MKVLLDIQPGKANLLMELLSDLPFVEARRISEKDAAALEELKRIQDAHRLAAKVRTGKIKTRPARDLLNEL